jgi:hypothetical protein
MLRADNSFFKSSNIKLNSQISDYRDKSEGLVPRSFLLDIKSDNGNLEFKIQKLEGLLKAKCASDKGNHTLLF